MPVELDPRTRPPLQRVMGTCANDWCMVRTLTFYVRDDHVPTMICPVCHREML
jgi:hypothetical protein